MAEPGQDPDEDRDEDWGAAPYVAPWWGRLAFAVSVAGFAVSLYLTVEHFRGAPLSCPATGVINCVKVTTSGESYFLGIPVALLGLLFWTALVAVDLPPLWRAAEPWRTRLAWLRLLMSAGGMCFVLWLLAAELFIIKAICLWCTAVHVLTFVLFVLVMATLPALLGRGFEDEG